MKTLTTPEDQAGTHSITLLEQDQPDSSVAWTTVLVDQYSGNILAKGTI
jgi:uncharacterized iron-regulated membrane protein